MNTTPRRREFDTRSVAGVACCLALLSALIPAVGRAEEPDERIPEGAIILPSEIVEQFTTVPVDGSVQIVDFPVTNSQNATIEVFRRDLYASAARIDVFITDDSGTASETTLQATTRRFFRGRTLQGYEARVSFIFYDDGLLLGYSQVQEGVYRLGGVLESSGSTARSTPRGQSLDAARTTVEPLGARDRSLAGTDPGAPDAATLVGGLLPDEVEPFVCNVEYETLLLPPPSSSRAEPSGLRSARVASTRAAPSELKTAILAFDTDSTFMARKFGNAPDLAREWIEEAVNLINVSLELDLGLRVFIGDIILRGGTDPYANQDAVATESALSEFQQYWVANESHRERTFAMLLSGNSQEPNYATGIAAVNSFCQENRGYSVSQVFVADVDVSNDARLLVHEVGHMLGSQHTHCTFYEPQEEAEPVPVDSCFNQEAGCHNGPVTCPVSGRGTAMSLCNQTGCRRPNADGFSTTVQGILRDQIEGNPACFPAVDALLFRDGFEIGSTDRWVQ